MSHATIAVPPGQTPVHVKPIGGLGYVLSVQVLLLFGAIPGLTGPVWWGALVKERGYDIVALGTMQTANAITGFVVGTLLAVTLQRLDRRLVMVSAALVMLLAEVATAFTTSLPAFFAVRAAHSAAMGVVSILAIVYLGYTASPTKAYAWYTTLQTLMQSAALFAIPVLAKTFGFNGVQWTLAGTAAVMALLCLRMPRRAPIAWNAGTVAAAPGIAAGKALPIAWIPAIPAIFSWFAFNFYITDFFAYSERFGNARGIDAETIGLVLAVTTAVGLPASLFVSWLGERMGLFWPVVVGALFGLGSAVLLLLPQFGLPGYWVAMGVFSLVWSFVYPFLLSLFMKIDPLGRLTVATQPIRMALNVGMAAVTTGATAWWGLPAVAWLAGAGIVLCPLAVWLALRLNARHVNARALSPSTP
jgi:MFS transporter, DHA1 family, inner membrane transport protein